jgi:hypothetical protein
MEKESFCTGYCRMLDSSRTVTAETEDGKLTEVDCCYGSCLYQKNCPIAKKLDDLNTP